MTDINTVARLYIDLWNERTPSRRREILATNWTSDSRYVDPLMSGDGHDGVDALIAGVQQKFPDFKFALIGTPNGFGDHVRSPGGSVPMAPTARSRARISRYSRMAGFAASPGFSIRCRPGCELRRVGKGALAPCPPTFCATRQMVGTLRLAHPTSHESHLFREPAGVCRIQPQYSVIGGPSCVRLIPPQIAPAGTGDADLVRRALARDEAAVRAIMQANNRRLYRLARGMLRNDGEAEDVVQETYVRAFTHLESFRGDSSLATWLSRIAMNEALGRLRRQRPGVDIDSLPQGVLEAQIIQFPLRRRRRPGKIHGPT